MNKELAVGYCRVSTKKQEDMGLSLDAQEDYIRNWVDGNFGLVKIFKVQESGGDSERKHLMKTFNYCLENSIKHILITDLDRWTRSREMDIEAQKFIKKHDLQVHIITENKVIGKFGRADDELIHNLLVDIKDHKRKDIKEKVLEKLRYKLEKLNEYPGSVPLGYRSISKTITRRQRIVQTEDAPKVKRLLEMFNTGKFTVRQAIKLAKDIGLKPKRKGEFTKGALAKILKNRFFYGDFEWSHPWVGDGKQKIYENKTDGFEPLISKKLWQENQQILRNRQKNLKENQGRGKKFKLNDLVTCGKCGRVFYGEKFEHEIRYETKKKGLVTKQYSYPTRYHCTKGLWYSADGYFVPPEYFDHVDKKRLQISKDITYREDGKKKIWLRKDTPLESHTCDMPSFNEDELERLIMEEIELISFNEDHWKEIKNKLFQDETKEFLDYEIRTLRSELTKNEIRLDELYDDWKAGNIDSEFHKTRNKRIRERQLEAKERLSELEEERECYDETIAKGVEVLDSLKNWKKIFKEADIEKRKHLLRLLTIKIFTDLRDSMDKNEKAKEKAINLVFTPEVRTLFELGLIEADSKVEHARLDDISFNCEKFGYG